jgi:hypothetical protein
LSSAIKKKKKSRKLPAIAVSTARNLQTSHIVALAEIMKNAEGWDGKMRVEPKDPQEPKEPKELKAVITNPEALEDSDYSDPDAPPVDEIEADEGTNPAG